MIRKPARIKALALLPLLASCIAPVYARRDYQQYPAYRGEIAFYNIRQIAQNVCQEYLVNPLEFSCAQEPYCTQFSAVPRAYGGGMSCSTIDFILRTRLEWKKVRSENIGSGGVKGKYVLICPGPFSKYTETYAGSISSTACQRLQTKNQRQAEEMAEAMRIYLESRLENN